MEGRAAGISLDGGQLKTARSFFGFTQKNSRSIVASGVLFKAVFTGTDVDFSPHHEQGFDKVKSLGKVRGGGPGRGEETFLEKGFLSPPPIIPQNYAKSGSRAARPLASMILT